MVWIVVAGLLALRGTLADHAPVPEVVLRVLSLGVRGAAQIQDLRVHVSLASL